MKETNNDRCNVPSLYFFMEKDRGLPYKDQMPSQSMVSTSTVNAKCKEGDKEITFKLDTSISYLPPRNFNFQISSSSIKYTVLSDGVDLNTAQQMITDGINTGKDCVIETLRSFGKTYKMAEEDDGGFFRMSSLLWRSCPPPFSTDPTYTEKQWPSVELYKVQKFLNTSCKTSNSSVDFSNSYKILPSNSVLLNDCGPTLPILLTMASVSAALFGLVCGAFILRALIKSLSSQRQDNRRESLLPFYGGRSNSSTLFSDRTSEDKKNIVWLNIIYIKQIQQDNSELDNTVREINKTFDEGYPNYNQELKNFITKQRLGKKDYLSYGGMDPSDTANVPCAFDKEEKIYDLLDLTKQKVDLGKITPHYQAVLDYEEFLKYTAKPK